MPTAIAALVTRHGEPPEIGSYEPPELQPGQALIRVTAAPLNPVDRLCASGTSYFGAPGLPYVPGVQGVGTVLRGHRLGAGTRVWFTTEAGIRPGDGAMAELAVAEEAQSVPLPDGVDEATAAALGLSAVAAWSVLTGPGQLTEGEQVVVLGGSGVVGQVAVQAARLLGARRVVATSRSAAGRELVTEIGADAVVDPTGMDVDELAARLEVACDGPPDLVVDPVCGDSATAALRLLAPGGRLVNLGSSGGPTAVFDSAIIRSRQLAILGYTNNGLTREARRDAFTAVLRHAAAGRLRVAYRVVPLEQIGQEWAPGPDAPPGRVVFAPPSG